MIKKLGHQRGGSHSKKQFDKYYRRNFYAKELFRTDGNYRPRVVEPYEEKAPSKNEMLKELDDYTEEDELATLDEKWQKFLDECLK